jgi:surface antigen
LTPVRVVQFVQSSRRIRALRTALVAAGVLGIATLATQAGSAPTAAAAPGLHYQRGYSVQQGWLCYGWSNGAYHCTQHWHQSGGRLISDNPAWVPANGASSSAVVTSWRPAAPQPRSAPAPLTAAGSGGISAAPSGISAWAAPAGRASYGMADFAGDPYHSLFGWCTWYAWYRHQGEPLMQLGNAAQWAYTAPAHGLRVGGTPVPGATVVFQPGVQGASGAGHVAHVEAVYGNGWFLVSEMNFYWNGGGWQRVDYRYAHTGPGVSFIY